MKIWWRKESIYVRVLWLVDDIESSTASSDRIKCICANERWMTLNVLSARRHRTSVPHPAYCTLHINSRSSSIPDTMTLDALTWRAQLTHVSSSSRRTSFRKSFVQQDFHDDSTLAAVRNLLNTSTSTRIALPSVSHQPPWSPLAKLGRKPHLRTKHHLSVSFINLSIRKCEPIKNRPFLGSSNSPNLVLSRTCPPHPCNGGAEIASNWFWQ